MIEESAGRLWVSTCLYGFQIFPYQPHCEGDTRSLPFLNEPRLTAEVKTTKNGVRTPVSPQGFLLDSLTVDTLFHLSNQ